MSDKAFQDLMPGNHCWGCGPLNEHGLHLRSFWDKPGELSISNWTPLPYFMAGPTHVLNGGIIATILDCHSICTAVAHAFHREERIIDDSIWYVTGALNISYKAPTPIDQPVFLRADVGEWKEKKTIIQASLYSGDMLCATAEAIAVRVPAEWRHVHG